MPGVPASLSRYNFALPARTYTKEGEVMRLFVMPLLAALTVCAASPAAASEFEVWLIDQSNSSGKTYGGAIYIYDGENLMGEDAAVAPASTIDLGGATSGLCLASTGANPVRPHMVFFNSTGSHAVLAFVASGHVVFFDAAMRTPVACFRSSPGAGGARQAHAAVPTRDDAAVLIANQNGKLLERISTDYAQNRFVHQTEATINLATCTTPNGVACQDAAVRPDNAPICAFVASDNGPAFV